MSVITSAAGNTRFVNFFPDFVDEFTRLRDGQCAALWAIQQTKLAHTTDRNCNELLGCILANTSEDIKANMASGTVALGLVPTILTLLGSTTGEPALLSRRRPLLAFLLACGSPAVNPLPTFVYENPLEVLKARGGRLAPSHVTAAPPWQSALIVVAEYLFVVAAIANVMMATYYTGKWTINTISCDTTYMPILWVLLTPAIHLNGMLALRLRTQVVVDGDRKVQLGWSLEDLRTWVVALVRHEITPCVRHDKLVLHWKNETYLYVAISWWTSFINAVHLLYGTIAFSSLVFLGYVDSIKIIGRLMASAVVCRAILMFELAGMRNALFKHHHVPDTEDRDDFKHFGTDQQQDVELHYIGNRVEEQAGNPEHRRLINYTLGRTST